MTAWVIDARARVRNCSRGAALVATLAATLVVGATMSACSSGREQNAATAAASGSDSAPATFQAIVGERPANADSAAAAPARRSLDLCRMLPSDTVARVLRETIGKSVSVTTTRPGGMCTYRDVAKEPAGVRVTIDIGRDRSPAAAGIALLETRGQLGRGGILTTDVRGVGDAAFGSVDTTATYSVRVQQGVVTEKVTVHVKGANGESLRPAAVALAKHTLNLLH